MPNIKYKLDFTCENINSGGIPVIVLAAGSSMRMKGISKQFVSLCGVPAIIHALSAFEKSSKISRIILVTKQEYITDMQVLAEKYMISKLTDIVLGGDTRQESVKCGLDLIDEEFALIHDGARPLVNEEIISRVCEGIELADCVICGVPVKDTIKKIKKDGFVETTIDRSNLFLVQTPQGVSVQKYKKLLKDIDCSKFTDDASIFENSDLTVKMVDGDYKNIKITTQDDIVIAESYLEKGGNEW